MAAIRSIPKRFTVVVRPEVRRRLAWLTAALVAGWMTATVIAVLATLADIAPGGEGTYTTAIGTAVVAAVLYGRFRHLGRIDEPLVLGLVICWAATLGLLSL